MPHPYEGDEPMSESRRSVDDVCERTVVSARRPEVPRLYALKAKTRQIIDEVRKL
jgi:hypothetical protein